MKPMKTMRLAALSLALLGGAEVAMASEVTITAEFRPSSTNMRFKNTTPISGFCNRWPSYASCQEDDGKSIDLGINYTKETVSWAPIERDRFYALFPGTQLVDVSAAGGAPVQLSFSFTSFSAYLVKRSGLGFPANWGFYVEGGCRALQGAIGNGVSWGVNLWGINSPESPTGCHVGAHGEGEGLRAVSDISEFSVAYKLIAPNPLAMPAGLYTGEVNYSVGENGQIALGNNVTNLNTNSLKIKFELDVQHAFELQFPANSDKVILEPPGGWMRWLNGGPAPEKLVRDLPFRITKTGPMSVFMECEYLVGLLCGVRNPRNNHIAALDIKMSLPGGLQLHNGQAVERHPIPTGRTMPLRVETVTPVFNQPGALHFATAPGEAAAMVQHPGDTYRGNVTVVFDALL
ncbi:hypothetical protein UIA24_16000 [Pseudomonas sp. AL 58]|uniref:hypothetical protein n=1 Tax=Pseudomonas sp. AL 58 TaxID=3104275 RepID=UPI002EBC19DD|nr:hypothetical protein [Pseudomonas sp. AL 58]